MNIAYFSNQFADAQGHGLARYSRELHNALRSTDRQLSVRPVCAWSGMPAAELADYQEATGLEVLATGRRLTPLCWTFIGTPTIEHLLAEDIDVVHAVALGYPIATRKPLVVTVHDLGPLSHPQYFQSTSPLIMRRSLAQAVKQAAKIICVSNSTARELVQVAGAAVQDRISVIHEGVGDEFFEAPPRDCLAGLALPPAGVPYILCTGKLSPRKNIPAVIQALASRAHKLPHHLVLAGGDGWGVTQLRELLQTHGLENRVHSTGYVSDGQLRALYRGASVYIHPSHYEGFGLTVLEAMASGCPVITSNVTSLPEVAGDAALLVAPHSIEQIAAAIEQVCSSTGLAEDLRGRGALRAQQFRWSTCAAQVAQVYASAAS